MCKAEALVNFFFFFFFQSLPRPSEPPAESRLPYKYGFAKRSKAESIEAKVCSNKSFRSIREAVSPRSNNVL